MYIVILQSSLAIEANLTAYDDYGFSMICTDTVNGYGELRILKAKNYR